MKAASISARRRVVGSVPDHQGELTEGHQPEGDAASLRHLGRQVKQVSLGLNLFRPLLV